MSSKYSYNYEVCSSVSLTLTGGQSWSTHWAILWHAFCAASLAGQMVQSEFLVDVWDFEKVFSCLSSVGCSWAVISSGYSFTIGLFVLPLLVWIWAARTSPSFPLISFSTSASLQCTLGPSLCTCTISPTLIVWVLLPVVLMNGCQVNMLPTRPIVL